MNYLPKLPYTTQQKRSQILTFRGINLTDDYPAGSAAQTENISAKRYPYITTRNARAKTDGYSNATSLFSWNDLVVVSGTNVYIGNNQVTGSVTAGLKEFAVVNTKLVIFPDKVYIDMSEPANARHIYPLENAAKGSGGVVFDADANTITIPTVDTGDFSKFKANDVIEISGCGVTDNNTYVRIASVSVSGSVVITVDSAYSAVSSGTESSAAVITFARNVPDMDFICASENRLWGCRNADQTIYASALGDPTNFYTYSGVDTDSYSVAVGTEGDFTGCCAYGSSVLFWKEELLHKVLGSYPSQYQIYTYNVNGLKKGCHKSLVNVKDVLFYVSLHGVYTYYGGSVQAYSPTLGNTEFSHAAAGSDGDRYYLSAKTGEEWSLWCYTMKTGLWVREDATEAVDFARLGDRLYMIVKTGESEGARYGDVYETDNRQPIDNETPWMILFTPFIETITGTYGSKTSIFARKRYVKLRFRAEVPLGSYLVASTRMDKGRWEEAGRIVGDRAGVKVMTVPIHFCDKFELKIDGKGPCTILNFDRDYIIGSERW